MVKMMVTIHSKARSQSPYLLGNRVDALQHHRHDAEDDQDQQRDVEGLAGRGVGLEDDLVEALLGGRVAGHSS